MERRESISSSLFKQRTINGIAESISYSAQQLNRIPVSSNKDIETVNSLRKWLKDLEKDIEELTGN